MLRKAVEGVQAMAHNNSSRGGDIGLGSELHNRGIEEESRDGRGTEGLNGMRKSRSIPSMPLLARNCVKLSSPDQRIKSTVNVEPTMSLSPSATKIDRTPGQLSNHAEDAQFRVCCVRQTVRRSSRRDRHDD